MTDYSTWCKQARELPLDLKGAFLESANKVSVIVTDKDEKLLLKIIRDDTKYVPRLKILGEVAYSLLDYHINPAERVTPNVCPVSPNTLWRQFINGKPGEDWRGDLYAEKGSLGGADLVIVDRILESRYAQRIALLDFIFLCQDRSARNWLEDDGQFWAVDNGMFWPYNGRHADKETIKTGKTDHLNNPIEAIVPDDFQFSFKIGIFSSLFAGHMINDGLLIWLNQIDWGDYLNGLVNVAAYELDYPPAIVDDWRFGDVRKRLTWMLEKRRFPSLRETQNGEWEDLISSEMGEKWWQREWEIRHLEKE